MRSFSLLSLGLLSMTAIASANTDTTVAAADPTATESSTSMQTSAPAPTPVAQGTRLRNGFSLSIGHEMGSGPSESFSGQLYGVDWRIGATITENIAVYADTHLSLGTAQIGGASGVTGNFATALIGEYTFPMRIFAGGGAGYGVLNNPSGPLAQARVGWYPFEKTSDGKARRLNVALDARFYFPGEAIGTVSHYALSVGYDRF